MSRQLIEEKDKAVRRLYAGGLSLRGIAKYLGVSHTAIARMMDRMHLARRPRGGNTGGHSRHKR